MTTRGAVLSILVGLLAGSIKCQDPTGPPPQSGQEKPKKESEKAKEPPLDETRAAAEALKKLLGPDTVEAKPGNQPDKTKNAPLAPAEVQEPQPQDPQRRLNETKAAAELIMQLFPQSRPLLERPPVTADQPIRDPAAISGKALLEPVAPASPGLPDREEGLPVHGSLMLRYRGRWDNTGDRDGDILGMLAMDVGDPERHPVTGHFLGRAQLDLFGRQPLNKFNGIKVTFNTELTGRLYDAYAAIHCVDDLAVLRIGRQSIYDTPETAFFDGVRVETKEFGDLRYWVGAHVGVPVYLFQSSRRDNFTFGASAGMAPWSGNRLRMDWMRVQNLRNDVLYQNDLLGLAMWQAVGEQTELHARYTWLEGASRDLRLTVNSAIPDIDLRAQASYYELLTTQSSLAIDFDPFSSSAFDYVPHRQLGALLSKGFGDNFLVTGGFDIRRLKDRDQNTKFNREYERYYLTGGVRGLGWEPLSLDVTGEYWDSDSEDYGAVDAELRAQFTPEISASAGTGYWLYKFDLTQAREQENVHVYYLGLDYKRGRSSHWALNYSFEDDDSNQFHIFRLAATWYF